MTRSLAPFRRSSHLAAILLTRSLVCRGVVFLVRMVLDGMPGGEGVSTLVFLRAPCYTFCSHESDQDDPPTHSHRAGIFGCTASGGRQARTAAFLVRPGCPTEKSQ